MWEYKKKKKNGTVQTKLIDGEYIHIPPREGEAKETLADISVAKKYLNWEPSINLKDWIKNK